MGPLGGALISAGGSILSSLFGSKKQESPQLDLRKLVADAKATGFNPLTVLQATGGSGFQKASSDDFDVFGQALGHGLSSIGDYFANEQNRELTRAQIDLADAQAQVLRGQIAAGQTPPFSAPVQEVQNREDPDTFVNRIPPSVQTAITAIGPGPIIEETNDYRAKEEGMKAAYKWRLPPLLPSTSHMEELHGDWLGGLYGIATVPVAAGWTGGSELGRWQKENNIRRQMSVAADVQDAPSNPADWQKYTAPNSKVTYQYVPDWIPFFGGKWERYGH